MITIPKSTDPTQDLLDMPPDELQREHGKAQARFDQARLRKQEADHDHLAAAHELNMLDRLMRKAEQREALDRRAAARSLIEGAKTGAR